MVLEICVDSVESAIAADRGGADRIELCCALREGGITPSTGLISAVREAVSVDVFVLIRPRGGDFVCSDHEFEVMRRDIRAARKLGVQGVVLGLLTVAGRVDTERTRALIDLARPLQVTFHRAFDVSIDLARSLEDVIVCGADRLLTSGGEPNAMLGIDQIAKLSDAAGDRIRIMAGAGVRESNVRDIVRQTGVREIHTSLGTRTEVAVRHAGLHVRIGSHEDEFSRFVVVEDDVRRLKSILRSICDETVPEHPSPEEVSNEGS
jgi:copper homeostasis protein